MKRLYPHHNYLIQLSLSIALVCVLQILVFPKPVFAATPVIDTISNGPTGNRTITWQHTVGTNPNRLLLVVVEGSGQNVTSVTYNGIALTNLLSNHSGTSGLDTFGLFNPPSGTYNIVVNGSSTLMGDAFSLYNVNQTDPWTHASVTGNCQNHSSNFCFSSVNPASATELWIQLTSLDDPDTLTFTPMATATTMWIAHRNNKYFVSEYLPGVNGTFTPSWNISPDPNNNYTYSNWTDIGIQVAPTPIPTATPTSTPIPTSTPTPTYTISGNVYNDINRNSSKDAVESNYAGTPTITASRGTVTAHADGSYTISNLTAGTVTISYTSIPSGFLMTYPLNGPPASFQVTVGPGCDTNGSKDASCQ